jgi:hypothetical protein
MPIESLLSLVIYVARLQIYMDAQATDDYAMIVAYSDNSRDDLTHSYLSPW